MTRAAHGYGEVEPSSSAPLSIYSELAAALIANAKDALDQTPWPAGKVRTSLQRWKRDFQLRDRQQAAHWVLGGRALLSFRDACALAGLDPEAVRDKLGRERLAYLARCR